MDEDKKKKLAETEAYLARIRNTIRASRELMESTRLRIAETDRLLERQGLTRETLAKIKITPEQQAVADAELKRMGFNEPLPEVLSVPPKEALIEETKEDPQASFAHQASANFTAGESEGSVENRKRKFNVMMQRFRM